MKEFDHHFHYFVTLYTRGRHPLFREMPGVRRIVLRCWKQNMDEFPLVTAGPMVLRPWSLHGFIRLPRPREEKLPEGMAAEPAPVYALPRPIPPLMVEEVVQQFLRRSEQEWQQYAAALDTADPSAIWQNERHIHQLHDLAEFNSFLDFVRREQRNARRKK